MIVPKQLEKLVSRAEACIWLSQTSFSSLVKGARAGKLVKQSLRPITIGSGDQLL